MMSYASTRDSDCQVIVANCLHSIASRTISRHQKHLACWVHLGWEGGGGGAVFATILKLSIRLRSITFIHLALNSHINAVWRSQRHEMLLLTGETLRIMKTPLNPS